MDAVAPLQAFFSRQPDIAAVYLYGRYAETRTWADSDIEIALLFHGGATEEDISAYMDRLSSANPLGDVPGILMPFPLNTHILPVIYEVLVGGTVIVDNDPPAVRAFAEQMHARIEAERSALVEEAKEAIAQARNLSLAVSGSPGLVLPQPPRYLDPVRIGWRLARILASAAVIEPTTRDPDQLAGDPERIGQLLGWFSNAAGAATGIAKAMLNIFEIPRPSRRWQVFLPLADANLMTMELALQMSAIVEMRWNLLAGAGLASPERVRTAIRATLPPIIAFARLAAWFTEVPGLRADQKLH